MCDRNIAIEWTDTHLYIELLGRAATRAGLGVTCEVSDEGLMTMVSGVPKPFEAFIMMCVSLSFCSYIGATLSHTRLIGRQVLFA